MKENGTRSECGRVAENVWRAHHRNRTVESRSAIYQLITLRFCLHSDLVVALKQPLASPVTFGLVITVALGTLVLHQLLREVLR